jgi:hypothetical protein
VISANAVNILLQFSPSYLCEQAFSCLTNIKSKGRNHLHSVEEQMRVCLTKIRPRIQNLWKKEKLNITLKVKFLIILGVNFISAFGFNFILTCYFDIFKGKFEWYEKTKKLFESFL